LTIFKNQIFNILHQACCQGWVYVARYSWHFSILDEKIFILISSENPVFMGKKVLLRRGAFCTL